MERGTPLSSPISAPSVDTFGFTIQRSTTTSPTTLSPSSESNRWSDLIPPKTALTFAVIWDPEDDLVAFSGAQLLDASVNEDAKLSPSEAIDSHSCSQILTIEPSSTIPESENTAILAFFRDNHSFLFSSQANTPILDKLQTNACRTQASSTLGGLDVYLRGSLMGRAHHKHRYYSCLENLDSDFQFDPRTSFAKMWMDTESEIDEGFFETARPGSVGVRDRHDECAGECSSDSNCQFVTILDTSSNWSTIEVPDTAPLPGLLYGDQERPRTTRRLRKRRPNELPVPPLVVLRRQQYSHDIPLPPSPSLPSPHRSTKRNIPTLRLSAAIPKFVGGLKRFKRSSDTWVCVELTQEITLHEI